MVLGSLHGLGHIEGLAQPDFGDGWRHSRVGTGKSPGHGRDLV